MKKMCGGRDGQALPVEFPELLIGTASAALQIEGSCPPNDWSRWAARPGTIADGSTPEPATDHWRRWREDNELMAQLGFPIARIGLEWARIEPRPGEFDRAVIDRYREELEDLRDRGIRPLVTLHHFVNPLWFADATAFLNPHSPQVFTRYVRRMVRELGDVVDEWVTINEPNVYAVQAHLFREGPPGNRSLRDAMLSLRHLALAHISAYRAIHELSPRTARVCFAHHARSFSPKNRYNPCHQLMTRVDKSLFQDIVARAALTGVFHPFLGGKQVTRRAGGAPHERFYDALGLNYYSRTAVSGLGDGTHGGVAVNDLGWEIYPEGLVDNARELYQRYRAPVWITENGTCDNGGPAREPAGETFRSRFILEHLAAIARADVPIERYYHWCFVDNWEWSEGYVPRFGIVGMNRDGGRVVKPSGHLLADLARHRRITPEQWAEATAQRYPVGGAA